MEKFDELLMGLLLIDMVELNPTKIFSHAAH
jgi:hypothetical protein